MVRVVVMQHAAFRWNGSVPQQASGMLVESCVRTYFDLLRCARCWPTVQAGIKLPAPYSGDDLVLDSVTLGVNDPALKPLFSANRGEIAVGMCDDLAPPIH